MRNYERKPNRFTLKMYYNGKLIVTTNKYGHKQESRRDFDSPFNDIKKLGKNPYRDSRLIQDGNNNPHPMEYNAFENSWESVDLGENLAEIFRLILRDGTEDYYHGRYYSAKSYRGGLDKLELPKPNGGGNYYTLKIIDNMSPLRDEKGEIYDISYLKTEYDYLVQQEKYNKLDRNTRKRLREIKREIDNYYTSRVIFSYKFSADEYSYDGKDFTPPMPLVWKDFNVNFNSKKEMSERLGNITHNYADISEFNDTRNKLSRLKRTLENILDELDNEEITHDSIRILELESELESVNYKILLLECTFFKGLRSTIKQYFSMNKFTNRFIHPVTRNNNFHTFSA